MDSSFLQAETNAELRAPQRVEGRLGGNFPQQVPVRHGTVNGKMVELSFHFLKELLAQYIHSGAGINIYLHPGFHWHQHYYSSSARFISFSLLFKLSELSKLMTTTEMNTGIDNSLHFVNQRKDESIRIAQGKDKYQQMFLFLGLWSEHW